MSVYRVKVVSYVVVEAANQTAAKAKGEQGVREAVKLDYQKDAQRTRPTWADAWEGFGFQAVGTPEKVAEDE